MNTPQTPSAPAPRTLDKLPPDARARIVGFLSIDVNIADRLVEMGFDEGAEVQTLHHAPMGDPIAVRVDGTTVALRTALASRILIEDLG